MTTAELIFFKIYTNIHPMTIIITFTLQLCDYLTFLFRGESRGSFHFLQYPPELHHFSGTNIPMSVGHSKL